MIPFSRSVRARSAAARQIRELEIEGGRRPTPIIALTASDSRPDIRACLASGMNEVLHKPIRMPDLQASLDSHLGISATMELSEIEADTLTELMNIGVGRGAAELSTLLSHPIDLRVPSLVAVQRDQLSGILRTADDGAWSSVNIEFTGDLCGVAALLIADRGRAALMASVRSVVSLRPDETDHDKSFIVETGNIVLNSVVGAFSNGLESAVDMEVPSYTQEAARGVFAAERVFGSTTLLMARTHVVVRDVSVEGVVMVVIGVQAFE